jgi:hypothetical protein
VKIKISCFQDALGKKDYIKVPEDLSVYISMNHQQPTAKVHDKMITEGPSLITYTVANRDKVRYPNTIYVGFET